MKHILITITVTLILSSCIKEPDNFNNTKRGNFEALWQIVDTRYCYLDYKNINWDSIHTVYSQKIDSIKDIYSFFDTMGDMLSKLKDGHVNLYSPFDRTKYWNWFTDYKSNFSKSTIMDSRYLSDNYREVGSLYYNKIANGKVGYIYYDSFTSNFGDGNIAYIFNSFKNCKGIILDIRNNGGGYVSNAEKLASYFFKKKTLTGYMAHKIGNGHSDFSKPIAIYTDKHEKISWQRPIVLLCNRSTYSAANDFVNRMQYAPNCVIVGDKTGGGGGMPLSSELPIGWLVRFSAIPSFNAQMEHIEQGIEPTIKAELDTTQTAKGIDTIIEKGVQVILNRNR